MNQPKTWICRVRIAGEECGQMVVADERPTFGWTDGHVCEFEIEKPPRFGFEEHKVFWNQQGEVVCACCHIPYPGSYTWLWERWQEIMPEMMVKIEREG